MIKCVKECPEKNYNIIKGIGVFSTDFSGEISKLSMQETIDAFNHQVSYPARLALLDFSNQDSISLKKLNLFLFSPIHNFSKCF